MSEKNSKKRLVKVEDELWTKLKARAATEQRPLFAVLATAMREYLGRTKKA